MRRASGLLALLACATSCRTTTTVLSHSLSEPAASSVGSVPSAPSPSLGLAASGTAEASSRATTVPPGSPDRGETELVTRMLREVETARGLVATRIVPGVRVDRAELIGRVKRHVARELPPQAMRNEGLALQLFGFVPTGFDYEGAEYRLLEDQLAGYYEPSDRTMYLASDLADEEAAATLAHELVHALQDQHWDLEGRSKYHPGDGDHSEAISALAEGDAMSAMFDVMLARAAEGSGKTALEFADSTLVAQLREAVNKGPGARAPQVMRSSLVAPYIYGTLFVNALRRRGGWAAVDRAWDDAPTTSEQLLHVEKWLAHEPALQVAPPTFAALGSGWRASEEDTEGELGTRIAFEEWMDAGAAAELAGGWGGDRGVLLENGSHSAFAWRLRYDAGKTGDDRATRAIRAVTHALDRALGPAQSADASFACHERADRGPIAVARTGSDIVFSLGPAEAAASGWKSAGSCALARHWIREIAGP